MKNILTIIRRELGAYFKSAIAYIFIIVFLAVSVGLFVWPFFAFPQADMRQFFSTLPIIFCIFIPAITMRQWAEERKENTYEMLLTFPMKAHELVLGKFLASMIFLGASLAGTLSVPLMLAWLGDPDGWVIVNAYCGALLLGALFLAAGIFFSGLFKDQIIAFVITLLACFGMYLLGTGFISMFLDDWWSGLGSLLSDLLGVTGHYNAFGRGVLELADVLFFLVWTALFLVLNALYVDMRARRGGRTFFGSAVAISLLIGMLFNWLLAGGSVMRFDMTEDHIYTVSDATKSILAQLKVPVQIKVYITPKGKMPTELKSLEQDILDKLEEMEIASGGRISHRAIHMEAVNVLYNPASDAKDEDKDKEESVEARLLKKGVQPFTVQTIRAGEMSQKLIYSSIGVAYKDKKEEIIPQIVPQTLTQLEYRLVNTIYKLTLDKQPVVALFAPEDTVPDYIRRMYAQMGRNAPRSDDPYVMLEQWLRHEKYDIRRIKLTHNDKIPDECDALLVIEPRELNDRQRWEINRFLVQGNPVFMAVQRYTWNYNVDRNRISISKQEQIHGVNEILEPSGLSIDDLILMDANHEALTFGSGNRLQDLLGGGMTLKVPTHIRITQDSMNDNVSITSRIGSLFYLWGTALKLDADKVKENKLKVTKLISTSNRAWKILGSKNPSGTDFKMDGKSLGQYPLMVLAEGQFKDAFKGKSRPKWPKPPPPANPFGGFGARPRPPPPPPEDEPPPDPIKPKSGKLILIGCAQMFRKNFLRGGSLDLFLNCVDTLALNPKLVNVRSRKPINRIISKPSAGARFFWKLVNLGLVNLAVAGLGIGWALMRRRSRNAYTLSHIND